MHLFGDTTATVRANVLSSVTVVDASGPEMDRGETVTVFNDLVVLALTPSSTPPCTGLPLTLTTFEASSPTEIRRCPQS
jgi:hypothetical protein